VVSCPLSVVRCPLSVGAKHLEDKLSVIAKNSSPNASPVQLLVGAKHLENKLSVIAKNSSPNASPVQWSVVSGQEEERSYPKLPNDQSPITNDQGISISVLFVT